LDAIRGRERSCDDDPSVVLIDRAEPHRVDRGPRLGYTGSGAAPRRIDVEESMIVLAEDGVVVVGEHSASQVIDSLQLHSLAESGRRQQSVVMGAKIVGDPGLWCRRHDEASMWSAVDGRQA
jgi:hypothetical protein